MAERDFLCTEQKFIAGHDRHSLITDDDLNVGILSERLQRTLRRSLTDDPILLIERVGHRRYELGFIVHNENRGFFHAAHSPKAGADRLAPSSDSSDMFLLLEIRPGGE